MIRGITLALAIAAASTSAAAQTNKQTLQELRAPYHAKVKPADPNAKPLTPPPADQPITPQTNALVDGCVHMALARVPKVEGARVASTQPEYRHSASPYGLTREFWDILVTVDFNGRPVHYRYACRITPTNGTAELAPFL